MVKKTEDPFKDWREWQDHRYDPGYFLGGTIHPLYKIRRSSPFGCAFLLAGTFALAFSFAALKQSAYYAAVIPGAVSLLMILAGSRMLSKKTSNDRKKQ